MFKSIERKILIPFLIIVLLPSIIVGIVSMWSSYQSDKQLKQLAINETLTTIERYGEELNKQVREGELTEEKAKSLVKIMIYKINGLYLKDENDEITKQGIEISKESIDWKLEESSQLERGFFKESLVITKDLPYWSWQVSYPMEFSIFTGSLPHIQKYILLISIITSIIAVELTIIFSHHLSKPIKNLAEFCRQVSKGQKVKDLDLSRNRKDEIGILSNSLEEMVQRLDEHNQQLSKMKQLNETILNSVHVGMILMVEDSEWIFNDAAKKMIEDNPLLKEKVRKINIYETKKRREEIWDFKLNEGKVYYVVNYLSVENIEGNHRYIMTFEDITERRKLEQRVERMQRLASLGEMASGIAHEIRNPLAGIKTTTQLLMRRLDLSDENLALAENMLIEIDRVNKIITSLLKFSRPIGSKPQHIKLNDTVKSLFLLMDSMAKEKNVKLSLEENNHYVRVDRDHLRQILLNLMINGINAMPNGGELNISSKQIENDLTIVVSDTGVGIKEEIIEKIFNPFFTTKPEGTGLGLSVVHQLVIQNEGEIHVTSNVNEGTTFFITFPIGKEEDDNGG
ncbi:ATP-binding protein [Bacillus manliponensis]|uniref:ATP-binding protein n=1 Tax=Bacillus manliponensis TaxID=574376 RepID=UPI0035153C6C